MKKTCVIGVDLGGTNVRAGAFYLDGSAAGESFEASSRAREGLAITLEAIGGVIAQAKAAAEADPFAVGMAVPGHVDDREGSVRWSPNFGVERGGVFETWRDVQLRSPLEQRCGLPIRLGNDANLAALGEYMYGSGKGSARCLVMFTVGTGIGGGVIMGSECLIGDSQGPQMLVGGNGGGGELGHMVIHDGGLDCSAGSYGAIEGHCQRDAIVRRALHRLVRGRDSAIRDLVSGDLSLVTPAILSQAAEAGDALALQVWAEVGHSLGIGIANAINIFAPDVVAVGGQIAKSGELLLGPAREAARDAAIPSLFADARIVMAEQIEMAGMLGAAALPQLRA